MQQEVKLPLTNVLFLKDAGDLYKRSNENFGRDVVVPLADMLGPSFRCYCIEFRPSNDEKHPEGDIVVGTVFPEEESPHRRLSYQTWDSRTYPGAQFWLQFDLVVCVQRRLLPNKSFLHTALQTESVGEDNANMWFRRAFEVQFQQQRADKERRFVPYTERITKSRRELSWAHTAPAFRSTADTQDVLAWLLLRSNKQPKVTYASLWVVDDTTGTGGKANRWPADHLDFKEHSFQPYYVGGDSQERLDETINYVFKKRDTKAFIFLMYRGKYLPGPAVHAYNLQSAREMGLEAPDVKQAVKRYIAREAVPEELETSWQTSLVAGTRPIQ